MLGNLLHSSRINGGYTQALIASRAGVSLPTLRQCEQTGGSIQSYLKLAQALDLDLVWTGLPSRSVRGSHLATRRKQKNMSQRSMASALGVSQPTILSMEKSFIGRIETLEAYLKKLRLTPRLTPMKWAGVERPSSFAELDNYLFHKHLDSTNIQPHFICGDVSEVLARFPSQSIDCVMTSPPYWGLREYESGGIGQEYQQQDYVNNIVKVAKELHRILKPTGSFWLNLGDIYKDKSMQAIPWRIAIDLMDNQGWKMRNSIIWNKQNGMDQAADRLTNIHENVFHFVKSKQYYYDIDPVRASPNKAKQVDGRWKTATGIVIETYQDQIHRSVGLSDEEKQLAHSALVEIFEEIAIGELHDFRMIIRGEHRTTHSDAESISHRAKRLRERGFYFLRYNPLGSKPTDVWDITTESTRNREGHYAAYPERLCRLPIQTSCPAYGVVLDPFCGTGTTMKVATDLGMKSVGIDLSQKYINMAKTRCNGPAAN